MTVETIKFISKTRLAFGRHSIVFQHADWEGYDHEMVITLPASLGSCSPEVVWMDLSNLLLTGLEQCHVHSDDTHAPGCLSLVRIPLLFDQMHGSMESYVLVHESIEYLMLCCVPRRDPQKYRRFDQPYSPGSQLQFIRRYFTSSNPTLTLKSIRSMSFDISCVCLHRQDSGQYQPVEESRMAGSCRECFGR